MSRAQDLRIDAISRGRVAQRAQEQFRSRGFRCGLKKVAQRSIDRDFAPRVPTGVNRAALEIHVAPSESERFVRVQPAQQ